MFKKFLSYKIDIQTNYNYNQLNNNNLINKIIAVIKTDLNNNAITNKEGKIYFETDFWRTKLFQSEIGLFNFTIDAVQISILEKLSTSVVRIELSFLRLLVIFYSISFLTLLIGNLYGEMKVISFISLSLLVLPLIMIYPLSLIGSRVIISNIERAVK
jgi:hypothetical protein